MAETDFTFKDATGATKTALAGANGASKLAPAAVLYAIDGTQLIGQKVRAASLPVALSSEDMAALTPPAGAATAANQATELASLATITTLLTTEAGYLDGVEAALAFILAKLLTAPATEAKQDTQITAEQAILAKLTADPATQTTLAAILTKLIAAPATEDKQDAIVALLTTQAGYLAASATLYAGTLTTSTSAAALAASQAIREVIVQNDPDSTTDVLIGNSSAQTIQLKPGDALVIAVANLATVYAKSVSGTPVVNYLGRS